MPSIIPALPPRPTVTPLTATVTVPSNDWVPYTVDSSTTLYATTLNTLLRTTADTYGYIGPLTNNGTMWLDVSQSMWSRLAMDVAGVVNNGLMVLYVGAGVTGDAIGFEETDLDNSGQVFIINEGFGDAIAVDSYVGASPVNTGTIAVQALHGAAYGFLLNNPSPLDNRAGGQILVEGMGAIAFHVASGDHPAYPTPISNAGTIRAVSLDPELLSFGLYLGGSSTGNRYIITNSGLISADVAIYGTDDYATVVGQVVHEVHNLAGGQIDGLIYLQRGADIVINAGVINGVVAMGEGADNVDNRSGTINGFTDLGWDNDVYLGGSGVDLAAGGRDNDNLDGGAGNDQLMGGGGNDELVGGAGNDGLFGEWGNDRIVTSGGDYVDGGEGNDRIELGDYTFEYATGGAGFDTLVLPGPGGVRTINLASVLAEGAWADFEQIELTGGKTLVIQAGDVTGLTGGETILYLATTLTDRVKLVGPWTHQANQTIDGVVWKTYVSGGVTILVRGTGTVSTNATNDAGALDPFAGGALAPVPGTTSLDFSSAVEVLDNYELNVPVTIQSHETFRSTNGSAIFTCWDSSATLTNYGLVESIGQFQGWALNTNNISSVVNYGTIHAEATGTIGSAQAIYTDNLSDVDNHGLIRAIATAGDAYGVWAASGINTGTIEARTNSGTAHGIIIFNGVFAPFENSGSITASSGGVPAGSIGAAAIGAEFSNAKDAINSGTILATTDQGLAIAVRFSTGIYQSSLTNTGTITATSGAPGENSPIAVMAYTNYSSSSFRLVNVAGAEITGNVHFDGQGAFTVQNSGLIDGKIWLGPYADYSIASVQLTNSGHVTGDLLLVSQSFVSVQNSGRIDGAVTLGFGSDWFDGRLGIQSGLISAGAGNDMIIGGAGVETMSGGSGADRLTGGAGDDIFRDTAANLSGDTITDLAIGDLIVISDAALAGFTFSMSGNTLTYTGGTLTLTGISGTLVASTAAGGGVQLTLAPVDPRNDFNGDGRSDILWRSDGGQFSDWLGQANGGFANNDAIAFTSVPTNWQVAGTGDFNGDGRDDILWRNDAGQLSDWLGSANGGFTPNDANAFASVPTNWQVAGTGDFNGDGRDDILWRNDAGQLSDWLGQANGGFANNDANAFSSVPTNWHVVGTGDFNGDGRDDILWRNDAGQLSNWLGQANGGFTPNDANAFASVPTDWHVAGTGDFNGDGRSDILWRSDAGQLSNWLGTASGGFVNNDANAFTTVPTSWQVAAVGDYDGDGRDDILWRNTNGQLSDWLGTATGGFTPNDANAFTSAPTDWHVQPEVSLL